MFRTVLSLAVLFAATNAFAAPAMGNEDSHKVTVQVDAISELAVRGGDVFLLIDRAEAGQDPEPAFDASTGLQWTTNEDNKKIVVSTDLSAPRFDLWVEAKNEKGGKAAGAIQLNDKGQDFIGDISRTLGACDLSYSAYAEAADGTGSETHVVTYTLIDA